MKILMCDDHLFYSKEIVEKLREDGHDVVYAPNFKEAESALLTQKFDASLLDVLLQNGKTGIHLAEKYTHKLGRIMFITGCNDDMTINTIKEKYACVSKLKTIWKYLDDFIAGGKPQDV
jgi:DNA-binding response OmpR family regulator